MIDLPSLRRETRYGMPAADQILFNRYYIAGYSYYFRQPKWALEIVNPPAINAEPEGVKRLDNFRSDYRIPQMFRADLVDFEGSGYDRGHMVPSADQRGLELQNSETFLLSNMSPQKPDLNRHIWRKLENEVRVLNSKKNILETYVVSGPVFYFDQPVTAIGTEDENDVSIPIPHAYFKSVLTEDKKGKLKMWSFLMDNEGSDKPLADFRVPTTKVEQYTGIKLWDGLVGTDIEREKKRVRAMW
ncbi:MAG: DNA/RNA non-specific endonuclease [Bacteroidales bacterium]|nr:DNA/RNA non-specific endonuclease [Bacteroidales bacterium]